MIIRRQLYADHKLPVKKPNDSGMELKPIFKKVPPSAAGNKVLQTASSGASIVRDVDDLLKPIQNQKQQDETHNSNQNLKERTERNLWRNDEVMEMLYTMQELKALERLNDKTVKSENVFKDVEVVMHRNGFVKKSHVQIWTKWKFLKSTYMTSRRNGVIPRMVPPQVYDTIHKMITGLNQSMTDSCSSLDGDNTSVTGMVISGVEGGVNESNTASTATANGEEDDSYGVAHPIFGFRLGMVKSEPEDTGYEAVENHNTDKDPLGEDQSPAKSDNQVKEENNQQKSNKEAQPVQKTLEIPHRGRGRPPKNPPAATSTPNSSPSPATKPAQMPPLRVAPFAKALNNNANSLPVNRPPPPLTMPPTPRIRVANLTNLKNNDPPRFAQPKLTPKPNHQPPSSTLQQVRLPKEVTATQTRASSTPSPSYPKMKQIPMRKTPYSLRPDRAIPDLDASLSPPPPPIEKSNSKRIEEVPSIRQLMLQSNPNILQNNNNNNNRKRRLEVQDPLVGKQAKYSNNSMENDMNTTKSFNTNTTTNNNNNNTSTKSEDYGKVLQNVMVDLSISLRKMQTEMMQDFFKKQNELLEKEHRFQMQQDHMLMKAFQEQTQEIMLSVKQLVGSIKTNRKEAKLNGRNRMTQRQQQRQVQVQEEEPEPQDEEMEEEHMEGEDEQEQEQEHDQQLEEEYTDGEEQQEQMEEHDDSENEEHEALENHTNEEEEDEEDNDEQQQEDEEQSQTTEEHHENGLTAEENEDENSNDSTEDERNPLN